MTLPSAPLYPENNLPSEKVCNQCNKSKSLVECFHKLKIGKYGYNNKCKECVSANQKQWRKENPELAKQLDRDTYVKYKQTILAKFDTPHE